MAMVSVIGRDFSGLSILTRGLRTIADTNLTAIGASQGARNVDVQFIFERDAPQPTIRALHRTFIEGAEAGAMKQVA